MRWIQISLGLALLIVGGFFYYHYRSARELEHFCDGLAPGLQLAEVRRQASMQGLDVTIEPHSQLRIASSSIGMLLPQAYCRVFFGAERELKFTWVEGRLPKPDQKIEDEFTESLGTSSTDLRDQDHQVQPSTTSQ